MGDNNFQMAERTAKLLDSLRDWCAHERGRQAEVARWLETTPQTVNDWLANRKQLTGEQALALLEFLQKPRPRRFGRTT
jgi:plasmid maintenance system antidote protein VapI